MQGAKVTLVIQARPLRRGAAVVEMEVMSYDQADVESDPGNNVVTENDQTQLVVSVPLYSKRMFMASSQQVNAPTRTVRNLRFAR